MAFPRTAVSDIILWHRSCVKTFPVRSLFLQILVPLNYKWVYLIIRLKMYIGFLACRCRVLVIFENIVVKQKCVIRIQKRLWSIHWCLYKRFRTSPCKRTFYDINSHVPAVDRNRTDGRSLFSTEFECSVFGRENALKTAL